RLAMDLRLSEAAYPRAAVPSAAVELNAKLLPPIDRQAVASPTFMVAEPAIATTEPGVVAAFDAELAATTCQISGWVLASGGQHGQRPHGGGAPPCPPPPAAAIRDHARRAADLALPAQTRDNRRTQNRPPT